MENSRNPKSAINMGDPRLESTRLQVDNVPVNRNHQTTDRFRTEMIVEQDEYLIPCIELLKSQKITDATKRFKRVKFLKDRYFVSPNTRSQNDSILDLENLNDELFQSGDYSGFSKSATKSANISLLSDVSKPTFENTDSFSMGNKSASRSFSAKSPNRSLGAKSSNRSLNDKSVHRSVNISQETPIDFSDSDVSDSINYFDKLQQFINKRKELMQNVSSVVSENISDIEPPARMLFDDSVPSITGSINAKSKTSSLQNSKLASENINKEYEDIFGLTSSISSKSNKSAMKTHGNISKDSFIDLDNLSTSLISISDVPNKMFDNKLLSEENAAFSNQLLSDISDISLLDLSKSISRNGSIINKRRSDGSRNSSVKSKLGMLDDISNLSWMDSSSINRRTPDRSKSISSTSKFGMLDDISNLSLMDSSSNNRRTSDRSKHISFSSNYGMLDDLSNLSLLDSSSNNRGISDRSKYTTSSSKYGMLDDISNLSLLDSSSINRGALHKSKNSSLAIEMLEDISNISLVDSIQNSSKTSDQRNLIPIQNLNFSSRNQNMIDNISDIPLINTSEVDNFQLTSDNKDIIIVKSSDEDEWKMKINFTKSDKKDEKKKKNVQTGMVNDENIDATVYEADGKISRGVQFPSRVKVAPTNPLTVCIPRKPRFSMIPKFASKKK